MNIALPQRKRAGTILVPNDVPVATPERPSIHELTVQGVVAYMQSHISESLSLGRLSDVAGFSPWHLDRIFTRETGLATMRYLTLLRIEAAKNAALGSDRRIIEIAYDVGFNSLGSFGKRFTYLVGMSPRDLRKAVDRFDIGQWKAALDEFCGRRPASGDGLAIEGVVFGHSPTAAFDGWALVSAAADGHPLAQPAACTIARVPGPFLLGPLPPGHYTVHALGFSRQVDAVAALTQRSLPRDRVLDVEVSARTPTASVVLMLRTPRASDAPIVPPFAVLSERAARSMVRHP
ncbi:AraC family transcriptional regulator [Bradyrhizobium liaoningense]|uniref:helix-turn-helix domain-containing protein n=1 Tax=Bradyrhizobium liaoningense TaxID=43992 RepID=UPI001BA79ADE|nr:AraC family transcriptional regulator [Bradyrhizobium liaoningense]MBR1031477.1 helix-turn-helix transcriptional regulator [Bradyrhizobium liaoningense]